MKKLQIIEHRTDGLELGILRNWIQKAHSKKIKLPIEDHANVTSW